MPAWRRVVAIAALLTLGALPKADASPVLGLPDFERLAAHCAPDVAPSTLAAVALTESGLSPLVIHDNTTSRSWYPLDKPAALHAASALMQAGDSLDLGLMQVNTANLADLGLSIAGAFDPCSSIKAGATILSSGYAGGATHAQQQAALRVAISRYNTGSVQGGFANGYVEKVEIAARRVVPALDPAMDSAATPGPLRLTPTSAPNGFARSTRTDAPDGWLVWSPATSSLALPVGAEGGRPSTASPGIMADEGQGTAAAVTYDRDAVPTK